MTPSEDEPSASTADVPEAVVNAVRRDRLRASMFSEQPKPRTMGRFVVRGTLGRGGMGSVLEAFDPTLDRAVALKLLHPQLAHERERLLHEARILAKVTHPNVVHVYEAGEVDGRLFLAMERVRGQTLRQWQATGPSWRECLDAYVQAGQGLAAAHAVGVVHRDFKPHNCMRDDDGRVRVLDFGLARSTVDDDDGLLVGGTRSYMAPEQLASTAVDARCDQFAFCVALSEAVHRVHPFAGDAQRDIPAATVPPERVPRWLDRALQRGMSPDPDARWPDMPQLLAALRPHRRGRKVAGVLGAMVAVSAATWWSTSEGFDPCSGAAAHVAQVWNDAQRSAAAAGMRATGLPLAETAWPRVEQLLEGYVEGWEDEHVAVCRATHVLREQSPDLLDRRMACLDQRLYAVSSMLGTLERADAEVVSTAVDVALRLPKVEECRAVGLDTSLEPPGALPLRRQLLDAIAELRAGHAEQALGMLAGVREQAQAGGFEPLAAEALMQRGTAEAKLGRGKDADLTLDAALWESLRVGNDHCAFEAAIAHAELLGTLMVDTTRSLARLEHAQALLGRLAEPTPSEQLAYLSTASRVYGRSGRYDEALALLDEAAVLVQPLHDPLADADLIRDRGSVLAYAGRYDEARVALEQVLAVYERIYGPRELAVANVLTNLGVVGAHQNRLEEAMAQLETAMELRREVLGDGPGVADEILNLAGVAGLRGDAESMEQWAEEAGRIYLEHLGPEAPKTLDSALMRARALEMAGRLADARAIYEDVLARQRRVLGERHLDLRRVAFLLGVLLVRMGHHDRAIAPLQLALDLEQQRVEAGGGDPQTVASLRDELARAREEAVR